MLDFISHMRRFDKQGLVDTPEALFLTRMPWIAPDAYLNIIYKPASSALRVEVGRKLSFPRSLRKFYEQCNGARLYFDTLRIYGCVHLNAPIDRTSALHIPPFDISGPNDEFKQYTDDADLICIGSYGFDRSMVCMTREDESIVCFKGTSFDEKRAGWKSLDVWLREELDRLSWMFAPDGRRLVDASHALPGDNESLT